CGDASDRDAHVPLSVPREALSAAPQKRYGAVGVSSLPVRHADGNLRKPLPEIALGLRSRMPALLPRFVCLEVAAGVEVLDAARERLVGRAGGRLAGELRPSAARHRAAEGVPRTRVPGTARGVAFALVRHRGRAYTGGSRRGSCGCAFPILAT